MIALETTGTKTHIKTFISGILAIIVFIIFIAVSRFGFDFGSSYTTIDRWRRVRLHADLQPFRRWIIAWTCDSIERPLAIVHHHRGCHVRVLLRGIGATTSEGADSLTDERGEFGGDGRWLEFVERCTRRRNVRANDSSATSLSCDTVCRQQVTKLQGEDGRVGRIALDALRVLQNSCCAAPTGVIWRNHSDDAIRIVDILHSSGDQIQGGATSIDRADRCIASETIWDLWRSKTADGCCRGLRSAPDAMIHRSMMGSSAFARTADHDRFDEKGKYGRLSLSFQQLPLSLTNELIAVREEKI